MIDQTMVFLRQQLDEALKMESGVLPDTDTGPERDAVMFLDGDKLEPLSFPTGAVSQLLVNVEQDRATRLADPHRAMATDGTPQRISPEVRVKLSVLFVARYKQYDVALRVLSAIAQFFQEQPVFERSEYAGLPGDVQRLAVELTSLPFAAQNEIWSVLKATYQPSLLYRVSTLVFRDRLPADTAAVRSADMALQRKDVV